MSDSHLDTASAVPDGSGRTDTNMEAPGTPLAGHMLELREVPALHVEPEPFQAEIITGIAGRLRDSDAPVLLRAPTGAGKTLMLARSIQETAGPTRTLWLWFAPYAHLVAQTMKAIETTCPGLRTYSLAAERQADHAPGDVLVANVQLVASSNTQLRKINRDDDDVVSLATLIDRARARGYRLGIVVDEAHLGLSSETVFGQLVRDIAPDRLLMATATPRDGKLAAFVDAAGYTQYVTFSASRIDAVNAGLNKRYVLAHVYKPRGGVASLADVRGTVLLRAWGRHLRVKEALEVAGVPTKPLMLVQVENGPGTVEAAFQALVHACGVRPDLIAQHSVDTPDPLALASIANDTSREVLIFKESAGTGFDAPRAFVLASMKHVSDEGFATQFLGRIMRVDRGVRALSRALEREGQHLPVELDVGYLYLADPRVQTGFQQAVTTMQGIQSELEGSLEAIRAVAHRNGSVTFTNVPVTQEALVLREPPAPGEPAGEEADALAAAERAAQERAEAVASIRATLVPQEPAPSASAWTRRGASALPADGEDGDMFGGVAAPPAAYVTGSLFDGQAGLGAAMESPPREGRGRAAMPAAPSVLADAAAVASAWRRAGVQVYPLRANLPELGPALRTEFVPALEDLGGVAKEVGERVTVGLADVTRALEMAVHGIPYTETATELTTLSAGAPGGPDPAAADPAGVGLPVGGHLIRGVVNRDRLAREAQAVLRGLGLDDGDRAVVLQTLADRIQVDLDRALSIGAGREDAERKRLERDVVHHLVRNKGMELERAYSQALAEFVRVEDAAPLPQAVLFPLSRALTPSPRNIYGVRPPTQAEWEAAELDDPRVVTLLRQTGKLKHQMADGTDFVAAYLDGSWPLNDFERAVAEALDDAEWVRWWHRNPPRKPYSVGVVKATERGRFYPDFVVCVQPYANARVRVRLLEPKENADDARQRMARDPREYGRVFFLKMSRKRIWIRDRTGNLEKEAGDDLEGLRELLQGGE